MRGVASIVLFAADVARTVGFYRALGIPLEDEDHGDGRLHAAADFAGVHVAVFPAQTEGETGWRRAGSTFTGFWVDSLAASTNAVGSMGARVIEAHQHRPWGCRAIVEDPDGRAVEINQADHCSGEPE